jgi:hypothetical protein
VTVQTTGKVVALTDKRVAVFESSCSSQLMISCRYVPLTWYEAALLAV